MMKALREDISPAMPVAPVATTTTNNAPPPNTIWSYTAGKGPTLWQVCGGAQNTCTIIANTKYYAAVVNQKPFGNCTRGDLYIVDRSGVGVWARVENMPCGPDSWIRKGSIKGGQYVSVDIGVGDKTVKQYPIGYWSDQKEFSGPNRPSWDKAKQNRQQ